LEGPRLPRFPVDALGAPLAAWVSATSEATQTPADLPAGMALAVLAAAVAGKGEVEAAPGWVEPLTLYVSVVLPSGERKTPVATAAVAPLEAVEQEEVEAARAHVHEAQDRFDAAQARVKSAIATVA